jgi:hypothetical protein
MQGARVRQEPQQVVIVVEGRERLGIARAADHTVVWQGNVHHETVRPYPRYSA